MSNLLTSLIQSVPRKGTILVLMFDTPVPVDYGGVYDVMARLRFLKSMGYELELICTARDADRIEYLTAHFDELVPYLFSEIHILHTKGLFSAAFSLLPFSTSIRNVSLPAPLRNAIAHRQYEFILVEHLKMAELAQSLKPWLRGSFYLRMHNDESQFYFNLSRETRNWLKKIFFFIEAKKYCYYQRAALRAKTFSRVFFISSKDLERLGHQCRGDISLLPIAFNLNTARTREKTSKGIDFLYVGNLESDDNVNAIKIALKYLSKNGFNDCSIIICGRCRDENRQQFIQKLVSGWQQLKLEFNVSPDRLMTHYLNAKVFLNFSTNCGGVKTKLVDALSYDLGILTNEAGVVGSGLDEFCINISSESAASQLKQLIYSSVAYENYLTARRVRLNDFAASIRASYVYSFENNK